MPNFLKNRFVIALLSFLILFFGTGWFLFQTPQGLVFLIGQAEAFLARNAQFEAKFSSVSLEPYGRLHIGELSGNHLPTKSNVSFSNLTIVYSFSDLFSAKPLLSRIECEKVKIIGRVPFKPAESLPDLSPFGCFSLKAPKTYFQEALIQNIEWQSGASAALVITFDKVAFEHPQPQKEVHPMSFLVQGRFKGVHFARLSFKGNLSMANFNFDGSITGAIFGRPLSIEFQLSPTPLGPSINGTIKPFSLELASFSKWLKPLWEQSTPVTFGGGLDVEGSWMFDPKLGFSGNLKGSGNHLHLLLTGLTLNLLELNADFAFTQGKLRVTDRGSSFLGFPASLSGDIAFNGLDPSYWNLGLAVPSGLIEAIVSGIPWTLRYAFSIPDVSGPASLTVSLSGIGPALKSDLVLAETRIKSKTYEALLHGHLGYSSSPTLQPILNVNFSWETISGLPPFLSNLSENGRPLALSSSTGTNFRGSFSGSSKEHLVFTGQLKKADSLFQLSGSWQDSHWTELRINPPFAINPDGLAPVNFLLLDNK